MSMSTRKAVVITASCAAAALIGPIALSATAHGAAPAALSGVVTLIGTTTIPTGTDRSTILFGAPSCPNGQVFSATRLTVEPSPETQFGNGVHVLNYLISYGAFVPLYQKLSDGSTRISELAVATDRDATSGYMGRLDLANFLPSPVPVALQGGKVPVTVVFFEDVGHQAETVFDVQVGGRCSSQPVLPPQ